MEDIFRVAACTLHKADVREVLDRVFSHGSLITVIHNAQDDNLSEDSNPILEGEEHVVPCTFDVLLTRRPSAEELRALGCVLGFASAELLEPYEKLVEGIRYKGGISFATVSPRGGTHWLDGQLVQTPAVLDEVAKHFETLAKITGKRAKRAKRGQR